MTQTLQDAAREVVARARAGDQVAMAHIARVHAGATAGDKKLQESERAIGDYINQHPVSKTDARWGADVSVNTNPQAQQALWMARESSPPTFAIIVAKTAPFVRTWDLVVGILHGPKIQKDNPLYQTASLRGSRIGSCVRKAFRLQRIASNNQVPISAYCRATGRELGEND